MLSLKRLSPEAAKRLWENCIIGDRSTDIDAFLRRTHAYSLKHFPNYTQEQNIERCYLHMRDKYGNGGYAKHYVVDADYIQFQHTIEQLLADKDAFVTRYLETTGGKAT